MQFDLDAIRLFEQSEDWYYFRFIDREFIKTKASGFGRTTGSDHLDLVSAGAEQN